MSRVGRKAVPLPAGVTVQINGRALSATGPRGGLTLVLPEGLDAGLADGCVTVARREETSRARSLHGLYRSLVANMLTGVAQGFTRELEIQGVGFRAQVQGRKVVLSLGRSAPVEYEAPEGVTVTAPTETSLVVSGADRQKVGEVAARLRAFRLAEPYKGKGLRYKGEYVRRKAGKTVA